MELPEASIQSGADAAALRSARAIVSGSIVDIGGHPLLLRATDLRRARAIAVLLLGLPLHGGAASLNIRFSARCPPSPSRPPDQADGGFRIWRSGERLVVRHGDGMGAVVAPGTAEVGGDDVDLARAFRQIFPFVICHLLAPFDRFVLHAAGLEWGGARILVLGGSGAGKSTVALAGVQAGWRAMSDDMVVVRPGADGPEAQGVRRPMTVPPEIIDRSAAGARPIPGDLRGRWEAPVEHWADGWGPVVGSVVTNHATAPASSLLRLTAGNLVEAMLTSFLSLAGPDHLRAWLPTAAALSRLPGWELRHGKEPARRNGDAVHLLGAVRDHLARSGRPMPARASRRRGHTGA